MIYIKSANQKEEHIVHEKYTSEKKETINNYNPNLVFSAQPLNEIYQG